jgi:hypothetical protein
MNKLIRITHDKYGTRAIWISTGEVIPISKLDFNFNRNMGSFDRENSLDMATVELEIPSCYFDFDSEKEKEFFIQKDFEL